MTGEPSSNPTSGETTIGTTTFSSTPPHCTEWTAASAALISAWDDEGSPNHPRRGGDLISGWGVRASAEPSGDED